jgi:hypothetical protein
MTKKFKSKIPNQISKTYRILFCPKHFLQFPAMSIINVNFWLGVGTSQTPQQTFTQSNPGVIGRNACHIYCRRSPLVSGVDLFSVIEIFYWFFFGLKIFGSQKCLQWVEGCKKDRATMTVLIFCELLTLVSAVKSGFGENF